MPLLDVLFEFVLLDLLLFAFELLLVVFVELSLASSLLEPEPYNSSTNLAVSALSATKNHNGYDGVVVGPYEFPGNTSLLILLTSILTAYGT